MGIGAWVEVTDNELSKASYSLWRELPWPKSLYDILADDFNDPTP